MTLLTLVLSALVAYMLWRTLAGPRRDQAPAPWRDGAKGGTTTGETTR